ncbi:hypothetical protein MMC18_005919 [Xylographa bjoerkii]|nr:hypothetical protein [Xylographa bjoerkii]
MHFSQILLITFSLAVLASAYPTDLHSNLEAREAVQHSKQPLRRDAAHHSYQPKRREAIPMSSAEATAFDDYLESIPQLRRRSAAQSMSSGQNLSVMSGRPLLKSVQARLRRRAAAKAAASSSSTKSSSSPKLGTALGNLISKGGCDGCVQSVIPASLRITGLNSIV